MRSRATFRVFAALLVVMAMVMMTTAVSVVWHHHTSTSNANCLTCQVVHQMFGPPLPGLGFSTPAVLMWKSTPKDFVFHGRLVQRQTSTRSPPLV
jgi:hypothetical protein